MQILNLKNFYLSESVLKININHIVIPTYTLNLIIN